MYVYVDMYVFVDMYVYVDMYVACICTVFKRTELMIEQCLFLGDTSHIL